MTSSNGNIFRITVFLWGEYTVHQWVPLTKTCDTERWCFFWSAYDATEQTGQNHYNDVIMGAVASQITSLTIVYSTVDSDADQRKHQSSASLAFVRRIHRGPVNSPHKWPVTRKMFPFDDVIMMGHVHKQLLLQNIHFLILFPQCTAIRNTFQNIISPNLFTEGYC